MLSTQSGRVAEPQAVSSLFAEKLASNGVSESGQSLPKWQIALIIGTPIVLGAGAYWYFSRRQSSAPKAPPKDVNGSKSQPKKKTNSQVPDKSEAVQAKERGNKMFKEQKYNDAIRCYTDAVRLCSPNKTEELATFYQNRAAAYEMMKKYREVIEDCSEAIKYNRRYTKALQRRAKGSFRV